MIDYAEKYDVAAEFESGLLRKAKNFTVSTLVDIGTTLYNSLPFLEDVATEDVLSKIDEDALGYYQQNSEAVRFTSLIGGALVPGGVALKLLGRARSGVSSLGFSETNVITGAFTGTRQKFLHSQIEETFRAAGAGTKEYNALKRQLYTANITKEFMDNAAVELAVVGALNAHPYMQDYYEDAGSFLKNFALGTTIGGVLGSAVGFATTTKALRDLTSKIEIGAAAGVLESGYKPVSPGLTAAATIQRHRENIDILEGLIAKKEVADYEKTMLSNIYAQEAKALDDVLEKAMPKNAQIDKAVLKEITRSILLDKNLAGVDRVRIINLDRVEKKTPTWKPLKEAKDFLLQKNVKGEDEAGLVFYRPSTGEVFVKEGAKNAALAADIPNVNTKLSILSKEIKKQYGRPVTDFADDVFLRTSSSAQLDLRYLAEIKAIDTLDIAQLGNIVIGPQDLPRMHAILARYSALKAHNPEALEAFEGLRFRVTSDQPSYAKQTKVIQKIIQDEKAIAPTYWDDIERIWKRNRSFSYRPESGLGKEAKDLVALWVGGSTTDNKQARNIFPLHSSGKGYVDIDNDIGMNAFRLLYNHVTQGAALPKGMETWVPAMKELIEAGAPFREELKKIADAEGYIYLYRGMATNPKGSSVTSWTFKPRTAAAFGIKVHLGRIHVDDVIGSLGSENEIIVGSITPQLQKGLPKSGKSEMTEHIEHLIDEANAPDGSMMASVQELSQFYLRQAGDMATDMLNKGFSIEEVSARLNMTKEGVLLVMMKDFDSLNWEAFRYTDVKKITEYLAESNRMYALQGNPVKHYAAEAFGNLDRRQLSVANRQMMDDFTLQSGSKIAKDVHALYEKEGAQAILDNLTDQLATVVNSMTGNFRYQSADQMLRALEIGPIITGLGKLFVNTTDNLRKELLEPVATAFQVFRSDQAALVGFNRIVNELARLKGWRDIVPDPMQANVWNIVQKEIQGIGKNKKEVLVPVKDAQGRSIEIRNPDVYNALKATQTVSDEVLRLHNLNRTIQGLPPIEDLGFYLPPVALVGKSYSFVVDKTGKKQVQLIVANSAEELASAEQAWKAANASELERYQLFAKGEQEYYTALNQYMNDVDIHITHANVAYQHKGRTASAVLPSDFRMVENVINSYENIILQGARKYHELYLHDSMYWLDEMSNFYQRTTANQPKRDGSRELSKNAPLQVKNLLLGRDQVEQSVGIKKANSFYEFMLNKVAYTADNFIKTSANKERGTKAYFDALVKKLENEGVTNPWKTFDEYLSTLSSDARNVAPQIQSAANGLLALANLRMLETAHALVNMLSMPILTWSNLMQRLPKTNVGQNNVTFPLRVMYDGMRHMVSAEGKKIALYWEEQGLLNQATRQFTEVTTELKSAYRGGRFSDKALEIANNLQENKVVQDFLAKPADWTENMTRRASMHIGYIAAKHAYPGIDDTAATIAAMNFVDRSIGNYHAAQRPGMFQGTFGAAIGLYQTYMLTYAQSLYRGLENRNFRMLATQMLTQAGIFGMASMPGYSLISEQLVANFNQKHWDATSGTYRAYGDSIAEIILFGLPSSLGPALYTRGDVAPRIPTSAGDIAYVNGIRQAWDATATTISKAASGLQNGNLGQSMMEALSLQSLSRPIARSAEIIMGESITRQGNTVSSSAEVWTPVGIFSRLLGTRPLEEQVVRNTIYANKYYESLDFERRQAAVSKLKTALRAGNLNDSLLSETALAYMKAGGTAKGWTSAMNELMLKTEDGARFDLLRKLERDSPLRAMIDERF